MKTTKLRAVDFLTNYIENIEELNTRVNAYKEEYSALVVKINQFDINVKVVESKMVQISTEADKLSDIITKMRNHHQTQIATLRADLTRMEDELNVFSVKKKIKK